MHKICQEKKWQLLIILCTYSTNYVAAISIAAAHIIASTASTVVEYGHRCAVLLEHMNRIVGLAIRRTTGCNTIHEFRSGHKWTLSAT